MSCCTACFFSAVTTGEVAAALAVSGSTGFFSSAFSVLNVFAVLLFAALIALVSVLLCVESIFL